MFVTFDLLVTNGVFIWYTVQCIKVIGHQSEQVNVCLSLTTFALTFDPWFLLYSVSTSVFIKCHCFSSFFSVFTFFTDCFPAVFGSSCTQAVVLSYSHQYSHTRTSTLIHRHTLPVSCDLLTLHVPPPWFDVLDQAWSNCFTRKPQWILKFDGAGPEQIDRKSLWTKTNDM